MACHPVGFISSGHRRGQEGFYFHTFIRSSGKYEPFLISIHNIVSVVVLDGCFDGGSGYGKTMKF